MRSDTDLFRSVFNSKASFSNFWADNKNRGGLVCFSSEDNDNVISVFVEKDKAREFARQLLEMCGDEND